VLGGCPKHSNQDFEAGRKAETLDDYDTALVHYERALRDQPANAEYKLRTIHMRMEDAQYHVEQGDKALKAGDLQTALAQFQRAQNVDPSNEAASQGLKKTMDAIAARSAPPPTATAMNTDAQGLLEGPPVLKPLSRTPINIKATEDSRMIYQTIASLAGLTVEFDPTLTSRRVTVDLSGVTLEQALDAVDLETGDFWQALTGTVIFVAPDNAQKRRDLEPEVVKTFYLANTDTPQDLTEIVTGLRQLLDLRRVQPVNSQNAIIIRDTPDKVALAEKIINDADKAKPEVLIHVQVLTADRDRLRDLGILGGQSAALTFNPTCAVQSANNTSSCTSTSTSTATTATTAAGVALNQLKNLSTADYNLTLPGATVNALLTDNQTRIIQDPQMRISDGDKATLTVGEKIPIATGSFQAGVGVSTTSVSPLVNTQFTYQDVGVKIVVTPRVHPDGSVTLVQAIDISSLAGTENIGGINQPIIATNSVDHTVRLKDGEASVLGGLITRTETKNLSGYPGVSQLPLLKYMFSDNSNEVQDDEVLIVLTPHVIRFPSIEAANLETIASGTDTNARVYRSDEDPLPAATVASTATAAQQQASTIAPQVAAPNGQQVTPGTANAIAPGAGAAAQLRFDPANANMKVGDTSVIGLAVSGVNDLYSIPLMIHYNPAVIDVQEVRDGGFLSQPDVIVQHIDKQNGQIIVSATRGKTPGVNGAGTLIGLVVRAVAPGSSELQVLQVNAKDSQQRAIPIAPFEATIQVQQ
jgi:general secretion pathway protein D